MSQSAPVPAELAQWIDGQIRALTDLVTESKTVSDHETDHQSQWTLGLLEELSRVEMVSRRMVHLLTSYALRNRLASPTAVAKATGVTITAAQNRNGSGLAQEVWDEVWPSAPRT
jgi:hypothetical protein